MSEELGDAATLERIAQARSSAATEPCLAALEHRDFGSLLRARGQEGEKTFLVYRDRGEREEISYADFTRRVLARAATLAQRCGVRRGDRVATLMRNHPETPITCFAAWSLGASIVPVNLGEDDERVTYVLGHSRARAALLLPEVEERAARLRERVPAISTWLVVPAEDEDPSPASAAELAAPQDEALVVYTSGTTGPPKGVVLTQQNLLVDADALRRWNQVGPDSRLLCVLPTHHVNGLVVTLITPFLSGASVVLARRFQTEQFWPVVAEEGVEIASVVPTLLAFLLEDARAPEARQVPAMRHLICGAGPLTVELGARFEDRFGIPILHGYGLSESTCYSCMLPVDLAAETHRRWMRDHGFPSIGVPLPPNEMAIHDADGNALPEGSRGEIVIRGVNVMCGYAGRPDANAETFAHGWFRSGDEGFFLRDEAGRPFFFITGRLKELIIRGGVNLSPFEIDEILNAIPGVARGLAVGFENRWYGEEVGAYVKLEPGAELDEAEILRACREQLPFSKAPKVVVFGDEIPVTSTGKYQRIRLRPHFERWAQVQFRPTGRAAKEKG